MTIDRSFLLQALLQHNYFPNQKSSKDELPPPITTFPFTLSLARRLRDLPQKRPRSQSGYDAVDYRLTRFNNVPRISSLPHPKAYATLALQIVSNWKAISYITQNPHSQVVPQQHKDGRLLIMDYEDSATSIHSAIKTSIGRDYIVRTDISNCFPSIYSHAVPWAAVGIAEAKRNIRTRSAWYNKIDAAIRLTRRNETTGIPIGPATSAIVAEMILARIDSVIGQRFTYVRYIDDYTAYCSTDEQAEEFVFALSNELSKYKLQLNVGKTETTNIPCGSRQAWVVALRNAFPKHRHLSVHGVADYLDFALTLSTQTPDGSVLKYGLKSIISKFFNPNVDVDSNVLGLTIDYVLSLSYHYSALTPLLEDLFNVAVVDDGSFAYGDHLTTLLQKFIRLRRSDAITWALYFCIKYNVPLSCASALRIIELGDCIPMLMLYQSANASHRQMVIDFAKGLDNSDFYRLDQYWLLLYQLYRDKQILSPYSNGDKVFETMKDEGVSFVKPIGVRSQP